MHKVKLASVTILLHSYKTF